MKSTLRFWCALLSASSVSVVTALQQWNVQHWQHWKPYWFVATDADTQLDPNAWRASWDSELSFWDDWIKTGGSSWPENYQRRMNASTPFEFADQVLSTKETGQTSFQVLDVGSGPVTNAGYSMPGFTLALTATDPLADEYSKLWAKHHKAPPAKPVAVKAEELGTKFSKNSFDLVISRNALDHGLDPIKAFKQMVKVVKPGHKVLLINKENEAVTENNTGMHQWNFVNQNDSLVVWNRVEGKRNASAELQDVATVRCDHSNMAAGKLMTCEMLKKPAPAAEAAADAAAL
eukprot:gnl/TRDRNA2_/TRDRNA2_172417_c0_seq1.p1 gnl/TRDRNA2_/TRDRNA2_172417_c0~~gnl/TRDRNA2_/TRDRNA2_172417_c0_seq1.p1  ORF type:complete len:290 (+),score=52.46 gnl/TRDRNA2_/TRDRNA2_172417_c0_seq1:41-910(+)